MVTAAVIDLSHFRYGLLCWKVYDLDERRKKNPTGLYYLLRDGLALAGLFSSGGNYGDGAKKRNHPSKRKLAAETKDVAGTCSPANNGEKPPKRLCRIYDSSVLLLRRRTRFDVGTKK